MTESVAVERETIVALAKALAERSDHVTDEVSLYQNRLDNEAYELLMTLPLDIREKLGPVYLTGIEAGEMWAGKLAEIYDVPIEMVRGRARPTGRRSTDVCHLR